MTMNPYIIPGILPPPVLPKNGSASLLDILEMAAVAFSVPVEDLMNRNRRQACVFARHAFCLAARTSTGKSTLKIGRVISRNHATVLNSLKAANLMIETNYRDFTRNFEKIKESLNID